MNLNELLFKVSLLDKMSGPAHTMMTNMNNITDRIQGGFNKIGYGTAGLWGVSSAVDSITKPAIEFESSMAAVNKVVDFSSPTGLKDFGADLLKMSRTIPIAASGLAEIAAAGGEQGIQLLDLPGFVSTVAKMSTAFDMSTSQAGESIGKLANIYHIPIPQMGALGDAINFLSNNTNSKASDIVDVLSRVGGIAGQIGITVNQTAALSAAMLSLGQPAEIAGTSINAMLLKLNTARNQSTDFISALSGIGLSVNQLEKNIQAGPQQAIDDFLGRISQLSKHDQALTLGNLFGAEYSDNLAILVGGLDTYHKTLGFVSDSTKFQGSMLNEFNIKSATTANQLQLLKNHWDNIFISGGTIFLPKINELMGKFDVYLGAVADKLMRWGSLFPNITGLVGDAAVGIIGIIASLSALSIITGVGTMIMSGFGLVMAIVTSPIAFAALGIAALGAVIGAAIYKWDEWGGAIMYVGKAITDAFGVTWLLQQFWNGLTGIYNGWSMIFTVIYNNAGSILSFIGDVVGAVGQIIDILGRALGFGPVLDWVENLFNKIVTGWKLIAQMALPDWMQKAIPGLSIQSSTNPTPPALSSMASQPQWLQSSAPGLLTDGLSAPKAIAPPAVLTQSGIVNAPKGGIMNQINNANNSKSFSVGGIYITNPSQPITGQFLSDELQMAAG